MTETATIAFVGRVEACDDGFALNLGPDHAEALKGLDGFGHTIVLWWAHDCDGPADRATQRCAKPYRTGPEDLGVFATRSPARPNPVGLSVVTIAAVDGGNGIVRTPYIDALPGTPIVDVKPYHPALDRALSATVPDWCRHWPGSLEQSAAFDWAAEFRHG